MVEQEQSCIVEMARLYAQAFDDLGDALSSLETMCREAVQDRRPEREAVLAAMAVQCTISDFATLEPLRAWGARLTAVTLDPASLETHAALIWCAGVIAAHQFKTCFDTEHIERLPPVEDCLRHFRQRLLSSREGSVHPNVAVATAEHPASWWSNTGDRGAVHELAVALASALRSSVLAPRIRARWLFWHGTIQMQNDQRALAEAEWSNAREATPERWPWIEFHLARVSLRPLLEDGQLREAMSRMDAMKTVIDARRPLDLGDYHHLRGWLALLQDEPRLAEQHYRLALDAADRAALPGHMQAVYESGLAQGLVAMGQEEEAATVYQRMSFAPGPKGEALREAAIAMAHALRARRLCAIDYPKHLARALAAARDLGLVRILRSLPRLASLVAADALELDIEPEFVQRMIAERSLPPPSSAGENWPWPVKLYGLRPFAIVVDGEVLRFDGKAPAKPLQLLRALIAHGGEPLSVGHLTDRLWPDLEAPEARRAFDVALNRLRALLVHRDMILLAEGQLRLDTTRAWLDVRALEATLRDCGTPEHSNTAQSRRCVFEQLAKLYRAPLLQGNDDAWINGPRESLRRRFLLGVESLARQAEHEGQQVEAAWMRQWAASLAQ